MNVMQQLRKNEWKWVKIIRPCFKEIDTEVATVVIEMNVK